MIFKKNKQIALQANTYSNFDKFPKGKFSLNLSAVLKNPFKKLQIFENFLGALLLPRPMYYLFNSYFLPNSHENFMKINLKVSHLQHKDFTISDIHLHYILIHILKTFWKEDSTTDTTVKILEVIVDCTNFTVLKVSKWNFYQSFSNFN